MFEIIENIFIQIANLIYSFGYLGLGIGMLLESACIPIPSEIVLPMGGLMAANSKVTLLGANIAVGVGSLIGSVMTYAVGYYKGRSFILKYGKYILFNESHFYHTEKAFNKYGSLAVFIGRLLPVVRTFISLPAGITRMNFKRFIFYSIAGILPWNFILIFLGYVFGNQYDKVIRPIFHKFEYSIIALLIGSTLLFIWKYLIKKREIFKG